MIIKIKAHKREVFQKILEYMINDKERVLKDRHTFTITHNLKGRTIEEWVKQYKANEQLRTRRRKDSVRLTHEILSWHRDDSKNITIEKMEDMARTYIRLRNPKGIYVAVPHFDKEHYHIHLCASGVEYKTGKALGLSKTDLQNLKKEVQNYQVEKFPELSKSIVAHVKKEKFIPMEKEYQLRLRTGRETNKTKVIAILKTCYQQATSRETFIEMLDKCNLQSYERSGKITGVVFENYKFRFSRLGFTDERFDFLHKSKNRESGLREARNNTIGKSLDRTI